ncbi:MAG: efflux RND transporter periplasmic adaptor subunit [Anaerolineales bacterium]|nr:efflux RND transporter periplasmic adaptor subunit [Anaerolineales bacterium]
MKKLTLIFALLLALSIVSCGSANSTAIQASGQIEAKEIAVAPEYSGVVVEVPVNEGDSVKTGDPLLRLDLSVLQQQRKAAAANLDLAKAASLTAQNALEIAQAQYQVALQEALAQDKKARLGDWFSEDQYQFNQPNWYFTRAEQAQSAQLQVDEAAKALADAKAKLVEVSESLDKTDFLAAEQRLLNARQVYLIRKDVNAHAQNSTSANAPITPYNLRNCAKDKGYKFASPEVMNLVKGCNADERLTRASQALYDKAKVELTQSQQAYDKLLTTQAANDVLKARADVSVAQEQYYAALDRLRALQTGDQSPSVTAAQGAIDQAKALLEQAQSAVTAAQANLDLVDTQMEKFTVRSPMDGVVLVRSIEVGEISQAGMPALTIGKLDTLKVTVYIPETQYGQISLGEQAALNVDSFPGESFIAVVTRIADKAEFTPQNVQTKEGRQTTVYAIQLSVDNADGKLKPGMPVDITFETKITK